MLEKTNFYIDGHWRAPLHKKNLEIIDPSTEDVCGIISLGSDEDVDLAVEAAKRAFPGWSMTPAHERLAYMEKILNLYKLHFEDMAQTICMEMGAPIDMARCQQAAAGQTHIETFIEIFKTFEFERPLSTRDPGSRLFLQPIGVVALITPWNWPMNQVTLKVIPAILAGCTMVLKPSEIAPLSSMLFAEILEEAHLPAGVFNLVNGDGATVGPRLSGHPDVDMISFTGSTRAGRAISKNAADTLKRVCLELGGKGANIIFADCDKDAVKRGVLHVMNNSGQSCNAPTRMFVERSLYEKAVNDACIAAEKTSVASAHQPGDHIGPVVSKVQYDKIQDLIQSGIDEGGVLLSGGPGQPARLSRGYFVNPTVFADVRPDMRIFREEIFGPVLSIIPFDSENDVIAMANDTHYGLTNYVQSQDMKRCLRIAKQVRSGMVEVNGIPLPKTSFFGGIRASGRAREGGIWGIEEFLETKAISSFK
ncbi:MAG: aldehyde dehydrogenase (NAD+) [Candidatus Tokpelaia sp. JSC085]|nr:MAG: aldehyde dehydrogenase (NAD+) [Candidatus Tokpelaia sp. JSC085]